MIVYLKKEMVKCLERSLNSESHREAELCEEGSAQSLFLNRAGCR